MRVFLGNSSTRQAFKDFHSDILPYSWILIAGNMKLSRFFQKEVKKEVLANPLIFTWDKVQRGK